MCMEYIHVIVMQCDDDEVPTEGHDPLDEIDLTLLDDGTIAAIYEELKSTTADPTSTEEKDFPEGQ